MKKRFSSLKITDLAAWTLAIAAYACLAAAGMALNWFGKAKFSAASESKPNLTHGI
jgi:hypothetical protein